MIERNGTTEFHPFISIATRASNPRNAHPILQIACRRCGGRGLTETVIRPTVLLHDGRGRPVTEAILWHGCEAEASRGKFRNLTAADRGAVVKFRSSL